MSSKFINVSYVPRKNILLINARNFISYPCANTSSTSFSVINFPNTSWSGSATPECPSPSTNLLLIRRELRRTFCEKELSKETFSTDQSYKELWSPSTLLTTTTPPIQMNLLFKFRIVYYIPKTPFLSNKISFAPLIQCIWTLKKCSKTRCQKW
jgi:hypothetical protein